MLGHGETETEIIITLKDFKRVQCDRLTLGQSMGLSLALINIVNRC